MVAKLKDKAPPMGSASLASLLVLVSVVWFLANPGDVHACKCAQLGTPNEELENSAAVFAGRVVSIHHSYDTKASPVSPDDHTTVGFDVGIVWKGDIFRTMYITTPPTGGSCGFAFVEGEEYVVYAYKGTHGTDSYTVGLCGRTALTGVAQADIDALGRGQVPQAGTGGPLPEQLQGAEQVRIEADLSFDFEIDTEGWVVGFADLPADYNESIFNLDHAHRPLPEGLQGSGIYIQGHNRSDDLFMFLKRLVVGLKPNTNYLVSVSIDLATNVAAGLIGIGGSPGESVFVKAGASTIEPTVVVGDNQHLRMNIDKGNQARGGESMVVLGNVANRQVRDREYQLKTLDNKDIPLMVKTDDEGRAWLIVGTDSGFEGLSTFYYSRISFTLYTVDPPDAGGYKPPAWAGALLAGIGATLAAGGLSLLFASRRRVRSSLRN